MSEEKKACVSVQSREIDNYDDEENDQNHHDQGSQEMEALRYSIAHIQGALVQFIPSMSDKWICENCGTVGLVEGNDGFFYCTNCSTRAEDYQDTGVADEDFYDKDGDARGGLYSNRHVRRGVSSAVKPEPLSQPLDNISPFYNPFSQTKTEDHNAVDAKGPTGPTDFGLDGIIELSVEDYYTQIRLRYVMGLQRLIELQCEALVRKFKVNPTICGLSATIWLRFLAGTRLFDDDWADSEMCRGRQGFQLPNLISLRE